MARFLAVVIATVACNVCTCGLQKHHSCIPSVYHVVIVIGRHFDFLVHTIFCAVDGHLTSTCDIQKFGNACNCYLIINIDGDILLRFNGNALCIVTAQSINCAACFNKTLTNDLTTTKTM